MMIQEIITKIINNDDISNYIENDIIFFDNDFIISSLLKNNKIKIIKKLNEKGFFKRIYNLKVSLINKNIQKINDELFKYVIHKCNCLDHIYWRLENKDLKELINKICEHDLINKLSILVTYLNQKDLLLNYAYIISDKINEYFSYECLEYYLNNFAYHNKFNKQNFLYMTYSKIERIQYYLLILFDYDIYIENFNVDSLIDFFTHSDEPVYYYDNFVKFILQQDIKLTEKKKLKSILGDYI